jgi:aspartate-semialdehyde dehydrogenase
MPLGAESLRVVIAGATSLRGKDLREWIDRSGFPAGEVRLVDEELSAGTLTEVAGEPAVVGRADSSSFEKARFVFFAGSPAFAAKHGPAAQSTGATLIDLSGGLASVSGAYRWIPALDPLLPASPGTPAQSHEARVYISPSVPAIVGFSLSAALAPLGLTRLAITFCQPVSERGQPGIEELENQTTKLLSFQPMPQEVFDTQVAFNLLDRWGPESKERLSDVRIVLAEDVRACLGGRVPLPAMTLIQAPVFYGNAFSAYAEFAQPVDSDALMARVEAAGFKATGDGEGPSNLSVAGEEQPAIGRPGRDYSTDRGYWFWGAADNMRVSTANALRIAERLLAS